MQNSVYVFLHIKIFQSTSYFFLVIILSKRIPFICKLDNFWDKGFTSKFTLKRGNFVQFGMEHIFWNNGILLPKLFWPAVRKNCSSNWEKISKIWGWRPIICKMRLLEQFIQTVKGQNNFWQQNVFNLFLEVSHII